MHDQPAISKMLADRFQSPTRRVLLVAPPDAAKELFLYATAKRGRYTNYPPYGLGLLATHLQEAGVEVRILNLNHEVLTACAETAQEAEFHFDTVWQGALDRMMTDFKPDLIGITCMFTMTHDSLKAVCTYLRSRWPVPLCAGGVHVTSSVDPVLDDIPAIDAVFLREAELAFLAFVKYLNGQLPEESLAQMIVRSGETRLRITHKTTPDNDLLDRMPAYPLMAVRDYARVGTIGAFYCFKPKDTVFATVLSSRGCRAHCTFCGVRSFNGAGVRQRSVGSVVDELQLLEETYGVGHIMWLDDDLLLNHTRAIELFNEMVRRNLKLTWDATNGVLAASCTEEVISAAEASGCIALNLGMESGNPKILRQIKKPATVNSYLRAADVLRGHPTIHASVLLMVGFPGETVAMIQDTVDVARTMDLDWCRISPLQPLPNTPIFDAMVAQVLVQSTTQDTRFIGGAYRKQAEIEQGLRAQSSRLKDVFHTIPANQVPDPNHISDIWFAMNYQLNFERLLRETRPVKIQQQLQHLVALSDIISPENAFSLYFTGILQIRVHGAADPAVYTRLASRLETSCYWREHFEAFALQLSDLAPGAAVKGRTT